LGFYVNLKLAFVAACDCGLSRVAKSARVSATKSGVSLRFLTSSFCGLIFNGDRNGSRQGRRYVDNHPDPAPLPFFLHAILAREPVAEPSLN
jgi:hypothetical protein